MVSPQPKPSQSTVETERTVPVSKEDEEQTASYSNLTLTRKQKVEETDIMTFWFTKDGYPRYKAGQLFMRDIGSRVFKAFSISERILTLNPIFIDLDSTDIARLEYLQRRTSKSVPPYLGRYCEPTK